MEKDRIPKWLKNLQENSWEVELLISGGAIFSLFQISDIFIDFIFTLKMTSRVAGMGIFIIMGMLGIKVLTTGFFLHLFLRAIWLGMVCINYVFPTGISNRQSKYAAPYKSKHKANDNLFFEIQKVDRAAGLVMFFSILSIMIILGMLIVTTTLITIPYLFFGVNDLYFNVVAFWMLTYLFDLLIFGILRKIPFLSYVTYPFFWVLDRLSLRVFYEKPLQLMSSNLRKKHALAGFSLILFLSIFFTYSNVYKVMHWPNLLDPREHRKTLTEEGKWMSHSFYMDQLKSNGKKADGPVIQSDLIKTNHVKLFIPYYEGYDLLTEENQILSNNFKVFIDSVEITSIDWYSYHSLYNDQLGIKTMIDISDFSSGHHTLKIFVDNDRLSEMEREIPFWKDN